MRSLAIFLTGTLLLPAQATGRVAAQTSYPMITSTTPVAVQRGKSTVVTVAGKMNFAGTYKTLFQGTGIQAEILPSAAPKVVSGKAPVVGSVQLKLTVAPEAALGVREFRLASSLGLSSIGQLVVVGDPVIPEAKGNNTREKAQPIPIPCVVAGSIQKVEEVDYYKFHVEAGQTLTFEVLCARLQDKIHDLALHADPMLTLFDAEGRELGANDDFYFADPLLDYHFPRAGDYYLQVRDSTFGGNPGWVYALFVTNKPYVSHVYPMAGNPGKTIEVEPVGSARRTLPRVPFQVPTHLGLQEVQLAVGGTLTNPTAFIVSDLPQVLEQEPNDTPEQATRVTIPCGINGRIQARRDLDHFVFAAKKGRAIRFEVKARRFGTTLRSSLDSVLDVMTPKGVTLVSNDDGMGKDAVLVFTPLRDGDYVLRIRDLNSKGGPTAVYHIEADWARPDFTLRCDPDKAMIGPGSSTPWFVHVVRTNGFAGPVKVEVQDLPKGVTASALTIAPTMTQGVIVLTADMMAPQDAANVKIIGTGEATGPDGKKAMLIHTATPNEEIYAPGGSRLRFDVFLQSVAVTGPSDILKVDVSPATISLKPGQEVRLDVTVRRRADYTDKVSLDIPLQHLVTIYGNSLPPGVTIVAGKSKTLLAKGVSKGYITLRAAPNAAPIQDVPISVLAHVSINFVVKISYCSPALRVSVVK